MSEGVAANQCRWGLKSLRAWNGLRGLGLPILLAFFCNNCIFDLLAACFLINSTAQPAKRQNHSRKAVDHKQREVT